MSPSLADLDARVTRLEVRQQRTDEDLESISDTVVETRNEVRALNDKVVGLEGKVDGLEGKVDGLQQDVGWLKRGVGAIIAHLGLPVEPDNRDD